MIECIAERRYVEPKPQRIDVRPLTRKYNATNQTLESIDDLVSRWHREVGSRSSLKDILDLPSSRRIKEFGYRALPAIIRDLHREPSWLVFLAPEVADENPVPIESRGNIRKMSEAWVSWYLKATS